MNPDKIASLISVFVAIVILIANFFQWWDITYDGGMQTKAWVKVLFTFSTVALLVSLYLILSDVKK